MPGADVQVAVIGAGVAGLAAALELRHAGADVCVLEAGPAPGGVLRSERRGAWLVEKGPNTMSVKAPALALLRRLGLEERLLPAQPAARLRFVYHQGRLEPLPTGLWAAARTPLLSARGKLRLLAEPLVRRGDPTGESAAEFARRRLGGEAERLLGTFLTGVYAGDGSALGVEAVLGTLASYERSHGSVLRGALAGALRRGAAERGLPGIHSTAEGLEGLARGLAEALGDALRLGAAATALERAPDGYRIGVFTAGGAHELRARQVLLATPARETAELLHGLDSDAAKAAAQVDYAPIVSVSLGVDPRHVRGRIEGFGFLVPRDSGLRLLGCLFLSQLFPGRAPEGRELLTCMLGGVRWREALTTPDDVLLAGLLRDLDRSLGLRETPEVLSIARWARAVPQPGREHPRQVRALRARLGAAAPGLALAGAWLDGVAVADAMASGLGAAQELLARAEA